MGSVLRVCAPLLALLGGVAHAAIPSSLTVQGVLETSGGMPASGSFDLVLRLWSAPSGGTKLYEHPAQAVQVAGGVFDAVVGPVPDGALGGGAWLEVAVDGEPPLPRRPLGAVAYSIEAQHAAVADTAGALACSGCVGAGHTGFNWAAGTTQGGAAAALDCTGCVGSTMVAAGAITSALIQDGSIGAADVGFAWAAGASPGGAATGLSCTGCIGSGHLAANLALKGAVTSELGVGACQAGGAGCGLTFGAGGVSGGIVAAGSGAVDLRAPSLVRVTDGFGGFQQIEAGAIAAHGDAVVDGSLSLGGTSTARLTVSAASSAPDLALLRSAGTQRLRVRGDGFTAIGASGPNAALDVTAGNQIQIQNAKPELILDDTQSSGRQYRVHSGRTGAGTFGVYDWQKSADVLSIDAAGAVTVPGTLKAAGTIQFASGQAFGFRVANLGSAPGTCSGSLQGTIYFDTAQGGFYGCDGVKWIRFGEGLPAGSQGNPGQSCETVKTSGQAADGPYWIDPDGSGGNAPFEAWCDMTTDGGGWTLVAKVSTDDRYSIGEPRAWFASQINTQHATSPAVVRYQGLISLGASRFTALIDGDTLARITVVAEDDDNQRGTWYKRVASAASFTQWFQNDPTASQVCSNLAMTSNCSTGFIRTNGDSTNLDGMTLSHHGYPAGSCPIHMRLDGDGASQYTAVCSCTGNNNGNQWHDDAMDGHWGNGLLIYIR
ncbi:MAG: hypothetical protein AMXMBFR64_26580 [Myxococcales bacterium]